MRIRIQFTKIMRIRNPGLIVQVYFLTIYSTVVNTWIYSTFSIPRVIITVFLEYSFPDQPE
jgi:hypothetical protein